MTGNFAPNEELPKGQAEVNTYTGNFGPTEETLFKEDPSRYFFSLSIGGSSYEG